MTKGKIKILNGHWWGQMEVTGVIETWAPIGAVANIDAQKAASCYKLARWYYAAGILDKITGPIIRHNDTGVIEVIPGTSNTPALTAPPAAPRPAEGE